MSSQYLTDPNSTGWKKNISGKILAHILERVLTKQLSSSYFEIYRHSALRSNHEYDSVDYAVTTKASFNFNPDFSFNTPAKASVNTSFKNLRPSIRDKYINPDYNILSRYSVSMGLIHNFMKIQMIRVMRFLRRKVISEAFYKVRGTKLKNRDKKYLAITMHTIANTAMRRQIQTGLTRLFSFCSTDVKQKVLKSQSINRLTKSLTVIAYVNPIQQIKICSRQLKQQFDQKHKSVDRVWVVMDSIRRRFLWKAFIALRDVQFIQESRQVKVSHLATVHTGVSRSLVRSAFSRMKTLVRVCQTNHEQHISGANRLVSLLKGIMFKYLRDIGKGDQIQRRRALTRLSSIHRQKSRLEKSKSITRLQRGASGKALKLHRAIITMRNSVPRIQYMMPKIARKLIILSRKNYTTTKQVYLSRWRNRSVNWHLKLKVLVKILKTSQHPMYRNCMNCLQSANELSEEERFKRDVKFCQRLIFTLDNKVYKRIQYQAMVTLTQYVRQSKHMYYALDRLTDIQTPRINILKKTMKIFKKAMQKSWYRKLQASQKISYRIYQILRRVALAKINFVGNYMFQVRQSSARQTAQIFRHIITRRLSLGLHSIKSKPVIPKISYWVLFNRLSRLMHAQCVVSYNRIKIHAVQKFLTTQKLYRTLSMIFTKQYVMSWSLICKSELTAIEDFVFQGPRFSYYMKLTAFCDMLCDNQSLNLNWSLIKIRQFADFQRKRMNHQVKRRRAASRVETTLEVILDTRARSDMLAGFGIMKVLAKRRTQKSNSANKVVQTLSVIVDTEQQINKLTAFACLQHLYSQWIRNKRAAIAMWQALESIEATQQWNVMFLSFMELRLLSSSKMQFGKLKRLALIAHQYMTLMKLSVFKTWQFKISQTPRFKQQKDSSAYESPKEVKTLYTTHLQYSTTNLQSSRGDYYIPEPDTIHDYIDDVQIVGKARERMKYDRRNVRTANVSIDKALKQVSPRSPPAELNSSEQLIKTLKLDLRKQRSPRSDFASTPSYSSSLKPSPVIDIDTKNYYSTVKFAFRSEANEDEEQRASPRNPNLPEFDKTPKSRIGSYIQSFAKNANPRVIDRRQACKIKRRRKEYHNYYDHQKTKESSPVWK